MLKIISSLILMFLSFNCKAAGFGLAFGEIYEPAKFLVHTENTTTYLDYPYLISNVVFTYNFKYAKVFHTGVGGSVFLDTVNIAIGPAITTGVSLELFHVRLSAELMGQFVYPPKILGEGLVGVSVVW